MDSTSPNFISRVYDPTGGDVDLVAQSPGANRPADWIRVMVAGTFVATGKDDVDVTFSAVADQWFPGPWKGLVQSGSTSTALHVLWEDSQERE